ncbi:hypothetical protein FH972_021507 [Carpinus fangiana]|uniref:ER membrane protein complex subunit 2 n=1 Tax=Carpinus fangiana TaxID=176857 RepID=A0A5N6KQ51_9ROSI|nr:hypothetical protein FH972_021507 [Carpinus fangiana]
MEAGVYHIESRLRKLYGRAMKAPAILKSQTTWVPWPFAAAFSSESPEKWTIYENLFYACLRTGDNRSASACLDQLKKRFGESNERVMGMIGMYHEATAADDKSLEAVLKSYEQEISERPTNMVIRKRHVALLKSMGRTGGATAACVDLLDVSPTDAEAWSELSSLYLEQGLHQQAIYAQEEVLLITPNAWNMHARLGEIVYIASIAGPQLAGLVRSMRSYCRSIELCDDYLRGFYGLKLVTTKIIELLSKSGAAVAKQADDEDLPLPTLSTVQSLNEVATAKLGEIVRKYSTSQKGWDGYEESEVIAARALLDRDTGAVLLKDGVDALALGIAYCTESVACDGTCHGTRKVCHDEAHSTAAQSADYAPELAGGVRAFTLGHAFFPQHLLEHASELVVAEFCLVLLARLPVTEE